MSDAPRKILVVDDEPDLGHLLRRRLRREVRDGRYEFSFAANGLEALEMLKEDRGIELVLSDINMPGMTGLALLEEIPQVDPDLPAVIISAYDDMENIRTAMNRGAFDFIPKPINFDDLRATIEKTLVHLERLRQSLRDRDRLVGLQNEFDLASSMQKSILPREFPRVPDYQMFGKMEPAREVGGDFFDVINLEEARIGLTIADVSGKGVPAALFMMLSRALMKSSALREPSPSRVLETVNAALEEDNESAMFVTLFHAVLEPKTGKLYYANAGHNSPLIVHSDGSSSELPATGGIALGVVPELTYRLQETTLEPGDIAVLYTDGVTEAMSPEDEEFGMERLRSIFADWRPTSAHQASEAVLEAVHEFARSRPQSDDITCLIVMREA